jgi:hypothetical protein
MFREYCVEVANLGDYGYGLVRQSGGLSSFHIPTETPRHPVWQERYGVKPVGEYHCKVLRDERLALGAHADRCGCRIIIDPELDYSHWGGKAREVRLESILAFLRSVEGRHCEVAIARDLRESLTIVGDWFAARSVRGEIGKGYSQTIFTRHAKTVSELTRDFDATFRQHLGTVSPEDSRVTAIRRIEELLRTPGPAAPKPCRDAAACASFTPPA